MSGSASTSSNLAGRARGRSCDVCGVGGCIVTAGVEGGGGGMNGGEHGGGVGACWPVSPLMDPQVPIL